MLYSYYIHSTEHAQYALFNRCVFKGENAFFLPVLVLNVSCLSITSCWVVFFVVGFFFLFFFFVFVLGGVLLVVVFLVMSVVSQMGIFPQEIGVAFPRESKLQQNDATHSY